MSNLSNRLRTAASVLKANGSGPSFEGRSGGGTEKVHIKPWGRTLKVYCGILAKSVTHVPWDESGKSNCTECKSYARKDIGHASQDSLGTPRNKKNIAPIPPKDSEHEG